MLDDLKQDPIVANNNNATNTQVRQPKRQTGN